MIQDEGLVRERIHQIIHREKLSPRAFAIEIGKEPSNIYSILSGKRGIPKGFLSAVIEAFPQINQEWLMFGDGSMYKGEDTQSGHPSDTRPRLPKSMSGGHLEDFYKGEKRVLCQEKPIITQFADYDFTLILKNNRMSPKYDRGDEIAFKKSNPDIIEWGNDYLLDTEDGPKFKKIMDDGEYVKCLSYNKEDYPPFTIPKNLIFGYYRCVGVLRIL